jgi:glycerophosphoryl diester phosphodiesterase
VRCSRREALAKGGALAAGVLAGEALALTGHAAALPSRARPARPIVLGHRGAPAHRPEHTLGSYARAIADGADFIEPDLVSTRDGVLIARHENNIAETTDVSARPEFAARRTTRTIDGEPVTGWFTEDFTYAEIKTLRAKERLGVLRPESQGYDGVFQVVSFDEIADFVAAEAAARGRTIGLIPELKHSTYFAGIGLPLEDRFLAALRAHAYLQRAPVIVQSFEIGNLKRLRGAIADMPNVQLMQLVDAVGAPYDRVAAHGGHPTYAEMLSEAGLAEVATYADWLSPYKELIIPVGTDKRLAAPTGLAAAARRAGLLLCAWTFRPENTFLPADFRNSEGESARNPDGSIAEIRAYLREGLDAFFTDDPAIGREAVGS